jgi:hypothetical protein
MHPLQRTLRAQLRLHDRLLLNCLDGMDDATAVRRLPGGGNNAAFLIIHLTDARHYLLRLLGIESTNPFAHLDDVKSVDDLESFPAVEELVEHWKRAGELLDEAFETLDGERLAAPSPTEFPLEDPTLAGALAFLAHHEAYHIGQLVRRDEACGLRPTPHA